MAELIIDLDEFDLRELFEIRHQRTGNRVKRPIRLAFPCEINIHAAVHKLKFAVARKAIVDHGKPLIPFHITRTFEEFIEHRIDNIL